MPGDIFAKAVTFSTVVRDGPYICKADIQASIKRCRCRLWALRARRMRTGLAVFLEDLRILA
jgi:hypothetical protein